MANKIKVVFKRGTKQELDAMPVVDGQLLYNTETGETFQDVANRRISIGGSKEAVLFTPQTLTENQKEQARTNIGASIPTDEQVGTAVDNYLTVHPVQPTPIDSTLTQIGQAADAFAVGKRTGWNSVEDGANSVPVEMLRLTTKKINDYAYKDGRMAIDTDDGSIYLDADGRRRMIGNSEAPFRNLISQSNMSTGMKNGCTVEQTSEGFQVTNTAYYGRYVVSAHFVAPYKKLFAFARFKVSSGNPLPFTAKFSLAAYKDFAQIGAMTSLDKGVRITEPGEYQLGMVFSSDSKTQDFDRLDLGLMTGKEQSVITFHTYNLVDISGMDEEILPEILLEQMDADGRYTDPKSLYAQFSGRAKTAEKAEFADHVQSISMPNLILPEDMAGGNKFLCDVAYADGKYTVTASGEAYGRYDITKKFPEAAPAQIYACAKVTVPPSSPLPVTIGIAAYAYRDNQNLSVLEPIAGASKVRVTTPGTYTIGAGFRRSEAQKNWNRLDIGITPNVKGGILQFTQYNLFDMTGMDREFMDSDLIPGQMDAEGRLPALKNPYSMYSSRSGRAAVAERAENAPQPMTGKKILCIGDSITAAMSYQITLEKITGAEIATHAKGGATMIWMVDGENGIGGDYDPDTNASGELKPLSVEDVQGADVITFYGGYNDRSRPDGTVGDCYDPNGGGQDTIAGRLQYCINRIYEVLKQAGNLTCRLLIVTPDCAGKYPWCPVDGYSDWPVGSGHSLKTLAETEQAVAEYNSIPCLNLWRKSGINRNTWSVFGNKPTADNPQYTAHELNSSGQQVSDDWLRYTKGESYYQRRNGQIVLERYDKSEPYPYCNDQLHKSPDGYHRIGEMMAGSVLSEYGKA